MPLKFTPLSDSELELMEVLWDNSVPMETAQVHEELSKIKKRAYTTVATFLIRMEEKNLLKSEKKGRAKLYSPVVSREEYRRFETESFLNSVHRGSKRSLLTALCGTKLSSEEIDELAKLLE